MIKKLSIALILLVLLCIAGLTIAPNFVPTDVYRDRLQSELSRILDREVTLSGDIKLRTFPTVRVETEAITIANPAEFSDNPALAVESLKARIAFWPLLSKRVEIANFGLISPQIRVERLADGRLNWGKTPETPEETEPFSRDGSLVEALPSLDLLSVTGGALVFDDAVSARLETLEIDTLELRLPAVDKVASLEGTVRYDGLSFDIDGSLTTPRAFLNGEETPFSLDAQSDFGTAKVTGDFRASGDVALDGQFSLALSDPDILRPKLPLPDDIFIPAMQSLKTEAKFSYDPEGFSLSDITANSALDGLTVGYTGSLNLTGTLSATGQFDAKLTDMSVLSRNMDDAPDALSLLEAVNAKGGVQLSVETLRLSEVKANIDGTGLTVNYSGNAIITDSVTLGGQFSAEVRNAADFANRAKLNQPDAAALARLTAAGEIIYDSGKSAIALNAFKATASEGLVNGDYTGTLLITETIEPKGTFDIQIPDVTALDTALPREIPQSDNIGALSLSGQIDTQDEKLVARNLDAVLSDGRVNGRYTGAASLGESVVLAGELDINTPSLREVIAANGPPLAASTESGAIYETFAVGGKVAGTPDALSFTGGELTLDGITGTGAFDLSLTGDRPALTGQIDFGNIDLAPYLDAYTAQRPSGTILPWSTETLDLSPLQAIDMNVAVTTKDLKLTRLGFDEIAGQMRVRDGVLTLSIPTAKLYGGAADFNVTLSPDPSGAALSLTANIDKTQAQAFGESFAGFDRVLGDIDLSAEINAKGQSQAALMNNLIGAGTLGMNNGAVQGLNIDEFLTGVEQAMSTRTLPNGLGLSKTTSIQDLVGAFSIEDGVAKIGRLEIKSDTAAIDLNGKIDIGAQVVDIGLQPKVPGATGLAGYGVPLSFRGGFGQAKASLDADALVDIAEAKARAKAGDLVKDRIGGGLGDILGGVISGETPDTPTEEEQRDADPASSDETEAEQEAQPEPASPEKEITDALKGLLGGKKKKDEATETQ